ncbi:unnamed protein product, partial [marine sediment metagenome]
TFVACLRANMYVRESFNFNDQVVEVNWILRRRSARVIRKELSFSMEAI